MRESPRTRRLRSDLRGLEQLQNESTILEFTLPPTARLGTPNAYVIRFRGAGFWKRADSEEVLVRHDHEVSIELGAEYPRAMPTIAWRTPIFHPNISGNGVVCLGGYGSFWAPSLSLAELCTMLWDMIRYENFDVDSPYNREAAAWAKNQTAFQLPVDKRSLRNCCLPDADGFGGMRQPPVISARRTNSEIVDAVVVSEGSDESAEADIIFIE